MCEPVAVASGVRRGLGASATPILGMQARHWRERTWSTAALRVRSNWLERESRTPLETSQRSSTRSTLYSEKSASSARLTQQQRDGRLIAARTILSTLLDETRLRYRNVEVTGARCWTRRDATRNAHDIRSD